MRGIILVLMTTVLLPYVSYAQSCEREGTMPFHIARQGMWASHGYSLDHERLGISMQDFNNNIYTPSGEKLSDTELHRLFVGTWVCILSTDGYAYTRPQPDTAADEEEALSEAPTAIEDPGTVESEVMTSFTEEIRRLRVRNRALEDSLTIQIMEQAALRSSLWGRNRMMQGALALFIIAAGTALFFFGKAHRRSSDLKEIGYITLAWVEYLQSRGTPIYRKRHLVDTMKELQLDRIAVGDAAERAGIRAVPLKKSGFLYHAQLSWFYAQYTEGGEIQLPKVGLINPDNHPAIFDEHRDVAETLGISVRDKQQLKKTRT